jgi:ATP-dependent RNA/DNA helicase IGHMBP2
MEHHEDEVIPDLNLYNTNLNQSQVDAIRYCLDCNELGLIHGPPGTGKTTTVVELILQSINLGQKILVVAPSNIAVDNIAEKLIPFRHVLSFDMVRIGHPARILESILEVSLDAKIEKNPNTKFVKDIRRTIDRVRNELMKIDRKEKQKRNDLKNDLRILRNDIKGSYKNTVIDVYSKSQVILATCTGASDTLILEMLDKGSTGLFDVVVIDECAQATEASCWSAVLMAKKLILAGDHLQLPPTIKSEEAKKELSFTLFDRMIKTYGEKVAKLLNIQYRMNESIMNFSSINLYENKLLAHESVRSHKVTDLVTQENDNLVLIDKNLILVDTSNFDFYESVDEESESKFNIGEAKVCNFIINYLIKNNVLKEHIGIITPYSAQVNHLRNLMNVDEYKELEISTVDGFQGREKEIIVLSLVRSNPRREVGFLADNRRLNVAITRAKRMLVLICDTTTVSKHPFIGKLCKYFNENAFNLDIFENILDYKDIEEIKSKNQAAIETEKVKKEVKDTEKKDKKEKDKKKKQKKEDQGIKEETKTSEHGNTSRHHKETRDNKESKKQDEPDSAFILKIESLVEKFLKSHEIEYKIEGLSNVERKYLHVYAESKGIIHESQVISFV